MTADVQLLGRVPMEALLLALTAHRAEVEAGRQHGATASALGAARVGGAGGPEGLPTDPARLLLGSDV